MDLVISESEKEALLWALIVAQSTGEVKDEQFNQIESILQRLKRLR